MNLPLVPLPNRAEVHGGEALTFAQNPLSLLSLHEDASLSQNGAYRLVASKDGIRAYAANDTGFFYARQTLLQLLSAYGGELPCFLIEDAPAYARRGFMIDCARHFFTVEELETVIDAAALLKMNVFHWHLSDDQGFRVESERFPALTEVGAVRPYSDFGSFYEPGEYHGFYSKEDIRRIVAFCKERHIEVVPEIDLPGHVSAILATYPELSCTGEPVSVKTHGGIFDDVLCAGKEAVFDFVFALLDEWLALFPDAYFHIGGDEVKKGRWRACPDCKKRMDELGFKDAAQLQGYFTRRIAEYLHEHGKTPIVWNDALNGGELPTYVCVQYWMGPTKNTARHIKRGGKTLLSGCLHCYFDYPLGITPLNKVYRYDPRCLKLPFNGILGMECTLWSEFIRDSQRLHHLAFPRMAALAEAGWTAPSLKNEADFLRRIKELLPLLEARGIHFAPEADWNMPLTRRLRETRAFARALNHKEGTALPAESE